MSRCFAFPPSGFVWKGLSGAALIEFIRVRKEMADAEKQKKKEEKMRTRKDAMKRRHHQGNQKLMKDGFDEPERSSITEEHGQPATSDTQTLYDSSDNTHNVKRRKISCSSSYVELQMESKFGDSIVNWVLPDKKSEVFEFDNLDWLFQPNVLRSRATEPPKYGNANWSGAATFVLPYTLIF